MHAHADRYVYQGRLNQSHGLKSEKNVSKICCVTLQSPFIVPMAMPLSGAGHTCMCYCVCASITHVILK